MATNIIADSVQTSELTADSVRATDVNAGNVIVTGAARFVQPIHAELNDTEDINQVQTGTISDSSYVMFSDGTNLFRVSYTDLIADLSTKVTVDIDDSEGVGY